MSITKSKPLTAPLVELRFLVPPALVDSARQAIAPYVLASVLPDAVSRHASAIHENRRPFTPVKRPYFTGVTQKELEVLLRE